MTPEIVRKRLEEIESAATVQYDDEAAHAEEDDLHREVLAAISLGVISGDDAVECATLALQSLSMNFARWYA